MNLQNFEGFFDEEILKRGFEYYKSNKVNALERDENTWTAEVCGSEDYEVTITLDKDREIIEITCDCPYDWGPYCKHQAATLYALQNMGDKADKQKKKTKMQDLRTILEKQDKQTLLSIVLEFAKRDKFMKEELLLRYSEKSDVLENARNVIKVSIRKNADHGFVNERDVSHAVDGAYTVLEMIDDVVSTSDVLGAISLCIVVLEEMMIFIDHCDDSDGYVSDVISGTIELIQELASSMPMKEEEIEILFNMVFTHAIHEMYNEWLEWRMSLLNSVIPFCENVLYRQKLEHYLSDTHVFSASEWGRAYEEKEKQFLQLKIIRIFDGDIAAEQYIEQNLHIHDFRRIAVQKAIVDKEFEKALKMCLEGEEKEQAYPGFISEWKHFRYEICEATNDITTQNILARDFVLKGEFAYFKNLKALYEESEWHAILQDVLADLYNNKSWRMYVDILVHEKLKLQLLDYCKSDYREIERLYLHLLPEYEKDVEEIFIELIRHRASNATTRSDYQKVCKSIHKYKGACGNNANAICEELAVQYSNRPAFLDELSKI